MLDVHKEFKTITIVFAMLVGSMSIYGCGERQGLFSKSSDKRDPIDIALASDAPDQRRAGVERLSNSTDGRAPWAIEIYETMAREDTDDFVRGAALAALAKHDAPLADNLVIQIFSSNHGGAIGSNQQPLANEAGTALRRKAARILLHRLRDDAAENSARMAAATCHGIEEESDHQTRVILLDALGHIPERQVLKALINALRGEDYSERRAAEGSLVRLTGETHALNPDHWESWLARTNDPFENAGQRPAGWQDPENENESWWNPFD